MPALPTLLYASPFPPQRSGISAYSLSLVDELSRFFRVTLLTGGSQVDDVTLRDRFPVIRYNVNPLEFADFDHVLYNVGNNPAFHAYIYDAFLHHPAPIILHDVVLYYLTVGFYQDHADFYSRLFRLGEAPAVAAVRDARRADGNLLELPEAHRLPLNMEFLQRAPMVFVHSNDARRRIRPACSGPVHCIPMLDPGSVTGDRTFLERRYGIPDDALVIASLGMIAPTKQNHVTCEALPLLQERTDRPLYHVMAGDGGSADDHLGPRIIKTGYLDEFDYRSVLARCDLVTNLRYPSMGETSISLIQAMAAGKACVVSDRAWFAELPDEVVIKIPHQDPVQEMVARLGPFLSRPETLTGLGDRAREYCVDHHGPARTAAAIALGLGKSGPQDEDG